MARVLERVGGARHTKGMSNRENDAEAIPDHIRVEEVRQGEV